MRIKNGRDGCVCTVVSGWVARMKCEWVGNHNDVLSTGITYHFTFMLAALQLEV